MDDTDLRFRLFGRDVSASRALRGVSREADRTHLSLKRISVGAGLTALPGTLNVVAAALAGAAGALATLPAVAAAGGVAFGALQLATLGFADALEQIRDPEKFAEQLKYLAPAAQAAATGVRDLLPQLDNLRLNVQQNFFENFIEDLKPLAGTYLPMLREGLSQVAASAGRGTGGLAKFLGKPEQVADVAILLNQTARAAEILAKALTPAADALLTLVGTGSQFLPVFATGLATAATKLATFLNQAAASGELASFMQTGIAAVGAFLSALRQAGRIIGGIFGAAISGGGLDTFADLLRGIADQVNSPDFQAGLSAVFAGLENIGAAIGASLPALANALIALVPTIVNFANAVAYLGPTYLQSVFVLIQSLAPALNFLSTGFAVAAFGATEFSRAFLIMNQAVLAGATAVLQAASSIPVIGSALGGMAAAFGSATRAVGNLRAGLPSTQAGLGLVAQAAGNARNQLNGLPTQIRIGIEYAVSISGPAGILGAGKYGGPGQGLGVLAPPGGNVTVGKKITGGASYSGGLAVGKGFGSGVGKGIEKTKDYTNNKFVKLARSLQARLTNAMNKLTAVLKARSAYIKQIRDNLIGATAITGFEKDDRRSGKPGASYYIKYLAARLAALKKYTSNINKLRKAGLNRTTLQQLLDAGVDGGGDDAAALAGGGKSAVRQVNNLQKQIGKAASGTATGVGNQFYATGVAAARGLVRGLQSQRKALAKAASHLAKDLRKAIRKELDMHSPSRVLTADGRLAGMSFAGGVSSARAAVNKSLAGLARPSATGALRRPAQGGGAQVIEVHNHLHAGAVIDGTNVIKTLDKMAKDAKASAYRPHTLQLKGA